MTLLTGLLLPLPGLSGFFSVARTYPAVPFLLSDVEASELYGLEALQLQLSLMTQPPPALVSLSQRKTLPVKCAFPNLPDGTRRFCSRSAGMQTTFLPNVAPIPGACSGRCLGDGTGACGKGPGTGPAGQAGRFPGKGTPESPLASPREPSSYLRAPGASTRSAVWTTVIPGVSPARRANAAEEGCGGWCYHPDRVTHRIAAAS